LLKVHQTVKPIKKRKSSKMPKKCNAIKRLSQVSLSKSNQSAFAETRLKTKPKEKKRKKKKTEFG